MAVSQIFIKLSCFCSNLETDLFCQLNPNRTPDSHKLSANLIIILSNVNEKFPKNHINTVLLKIISRQLFHTKCFNFRMAHLIVRQQHFLSLFLVGGRGLKVRAVPER